MSVKFRISATVAAWGILAVQFAFTWATALVMANASPASLITVVGIGDLAFGSFVTWAIWHHDENQNP